MVKPIWIKKLFFLSIKQVSFVTFIPQAPLAPFRPTLSTYANSISCNNRMVFLPPRRRKYMSDLGLTHIALPVSNIDASVAFYEKYAHMQVVHRRVDAKSGVKVV